MPLKQRNRFVGVLRPTGVLLALFLLAGACSFFSDDDDAADSTTSTTLPGNPRTIGRVTPTTSATATTLAPGASPVTLESAMSTAGLGPILIGHSFTELAALSILVEPVEAVSEECQVFAVQGAPPGVLLEVNSGEVVRVDVISGPLKTVSGYGVGSTEAELREAFGERIEDGPGESAVQFVPVDEDDADKRVVWELDSAGVVTSMRTGRLPHVTPELLCGSYAP